MTPWMSEENVIRREASLTIQNQEPISIKNKYLFSLCKIENTESFQYSRW